jgi:hypothetical protein
MLIEGDLRARAFPYESLLAACINAEIRRNSHVIHTIDADETAMVVRQLCKKAVNPASGVPSGIALPAIPKTKRDRDSEDKNFWIRQHKCVPSISERIARALLS